MLLIIQCMQWPWCFGSLQVQLGEAVTVTVGPGTVAVTVGPGTSTGGAVTVTVGPGRTTVLVLVLLLPGTVTVTVGPGTTTVLVFLHLHFFLWCFLQQQALALATVTPDGTPAAGLALIASPDTPRTTIRATSIPMSLFISVLSGLLVRFQRLAVLPYRVLMVASASSIFISHQIGRPFWAYSNATWVVSQSEKPGSNGMSWNAVGSSG